MKTEKRKRYIESIYVTLNVVGGKCDYINESIQNKSIIEFFQRKKVRGKEQEEYYLKLNPNKIKENTMIKTYKEYRQTLNNYLEQAKGINFRITRASLLINSDVQQDYELFNKLNRLLICCISETYNIRRCYQVYDLWNYKNLSIAVQSNELDVENHNKELEYGKQQDTKTYLKLRSKNIRNMLLYEFTVKWFERLDRALEQFEAVQEHYNRELVRIWKEDVEKPTKERDFLNSTAFLLAYKDCIFTRKQLENLIASTEMSENPKAKAKKFKERHQIEFYSKKDLIIIVKAIKKAISRYFDN